MNNIVNMFIAIVVILYFVILIMLYDIGADWKAWLWFGTPLIAFRLIRAILIIKTK